MPEENKITRKPLIIIAGPTASGKTSLSVRLAQAIGGEVISADSMQVYRHMDIGSAKVTEEERQGIPHYLIDVLEPTDEFNVVVFQKMAKEAMETIKLWNEFIDSGTADVKRAPFSLTNCIKSIFSRYTKLIESDGLNIIFEHNEEVFIMGDELRMTQVLYNLINNAINYIGEDKTVIVRQTVSGEKVRVDVIDHGEGIPEDKLQHIWDRYYRVDKEHRRAVIGTGLGLSIVKNILLAHDADFGVASKLGEGSDFYFILPIIPTGEE